MITELKKQIEKKEKELRELNLKLEKETSKTGILDIPELGIEVEIEVTHKGKSFNDIMAFPEIQEKIRNGWRLICTSRPGDHVNELAVLENNSTYAKILKMEGSSSRDDFFIQQMFKRNQNKNYVAWFYVGSGCSDLNSYMGASDSYSGLGVRFCRKKNLRGK